MRTFILSILLCVFDLAFGTNYPPTYYIPAGGQTVPPLTYQQVASQTFYVTTSGTVNLGSNTYTLTYATLPGANSTWNVIFDATSLTVTTATNVNLFGETPLATYTPVKKFYINFSVVWDAGVPSKKVTYFASLADLKTFTQAVTFTGVAKFDTTIILNDSIRVTGPFKFDVLPATNLGGKALVLDNSGNTGLGCQPWCVLGNAGLSSPINFLGMTDSVALRFRINNEPSGIIDYNLANTSFGYRTLLANTTGSNNTAVGYNCFYSNTTGLGNVSIGVGTMVSQTTANNNVGVGNQTLQSNITGTENTGIGYRSGQTIVTGSYNTCIGAHANVATSATQYAISLGYNATASSNQFTISGIRSIYLPNVTTGLRYALMDSSGTGNFVPQPLPNYAATTFTPVTGDSITITTSQNDLNAAGTIAVLTVILPASPYSGQILEFSTTQIVTSLLWSIRLSGGTTAGLPSTLAQYATAKVKWNSTLSKWLNY